MRSGTIKKATTQGIASSSANSIARFCAERAPASSPGCEPAGHFGHQHRADRNADNADRQLIDTIGVVERRDGAGRQKAGNDGVGKQRELRAGRADGCRQQRLEEAAHVVVAAERIGTRSSRRCARHRRRPGPPAAHPRSARPRPRHSPAPGNIGGERQRRHHGDVEQDRRGGRGGEPVHRVEHAAPQRHQRDQQQIRKRDSGQRYRERELAAARAKIRAPTGRSPAA